MNVRPLIKGLWHWTKRNSTKILAGGAIVAEALGFYFMHREAPIVRDRLEELPNSKWYEKLKVAGPIYLPAIGMFILSSGCVIGGCAMGERKAAIMASLYSASEASLRRLEQKMIDEVGKDKAEKIHAKAVEELASETPPTPSNVKRTGKGETLFFERRTGQWFLSSYDAVKNDENDFNRYLLQEPGKGLEFNDWLECLGAERASFGELFGFDADHRLSLNITTDYKTEDGTQFFVIDYITGPGYGPVMYNGKNPLEFRRREDCYIE